jgi:putative flavoprotein involved in K+ transport
LRDGFRTPLITELDLELTDLTNIIWATSYAFDFLLVKLPVLDKDGFPIQRGGDTSYPGLYFVGLPWLPTAKSSARSIVRNIADRNRDFEGMPIPIDPAPIEKGTELQRHRRFR